VESESDDAQTARPTPAEVDAAFALLSAEARTALWLALVEGASTTEVAESIGITAAEASLLVERGVAQVLQGLALARLGGDSRPVGLPLSSPRGRRPSRPRGSRSRSSSASSGTSCDWGG
jgi:hypothetical protein